MLGATLHHTLCILYRGAQDELWYGQLRLIFCFAHHTASQHDLVYIRWLKEVHTQTSARQAVGLPHVGWELVSSRQGHRHRHDVVPVESVMRSAYVQEDPSAKGLFFVNRYTV